MLTSGLYTHKWTYTRPYTCEYITYVQNILMKQLNSNFEWARKARLLEAWGKGTSWESFRLQSPVSSRGQECPIAARVLPDVWPTPLLPILTEPVIRTKCMRNANAYIITHIQGQLNVAVIWSIPRHSLSTFPAMWLPWVNEIQERELMSLLGKSFMSQCRNNPLSFLDLQGSLR